MKRTVGYSWRGPHGRLDPLDQRLGRSRSFVRSFVRSLARSLARSFVRSASRGKPVRRHDEWSAHYGEVPATKSRDEMSPFACERRAPTRQPLGGFAGPPNRPNPATLTILSLDGIRQSARSCNSIGSPSQWLNGRSGLCRGARSHAVGESPRFFRCTSAYRALILPIPCQRPPRLPNLAASHGHRPRDQPTFLLASLSISLSRFTHLSLSLSFVSPFSVRPCENLPLAILPLSFRSSLPGIYDDFTDDQPERSSST